MGVSRYQYVGQLQPTLDVPGVREVLVSPDYCAYPVERVSVLDEEEATHDSILRELKALCAKAKAPGARTFFYFSGHGGQDASGASYILPVDARKGQYATTAISARDLSQLLDQCPGELTVVLDCCRAAGMVDKDVLSDEAIQDVELGAFDDAFRNAIQSKGRVVFAASRADGKAFASPDAPYGIFTGHMLDGLRGAASTHGGDVTVDQLFNYLQQRVVLSSGKAQRPVFIASTEAFYPLTRYPRAIEPSPVFDKDVYISYDREDPAMREWVAKVFQPRLESDGRSVWDYDGLGYNQFAVEEAIVKSRYTVVLLTASYLKNRFLEFATTNSVLQAVETHTPRFIAISREMISLPLWIRAFVGLDMTPQKTMNFEYNIERLLKRLRKQPEER